MNMVFNRNECPLRLLMYGEFQFWVLRLLWATVIAHLYTSRLYNTHYISEHNSIALAWDSPHLQRSWRDHPEMIRDLVISGVK